MPATFPSATLRRARRVGANHSSAPSEVVTSPATKVPHNHEGGPVVARVPDDGAEAGAAEADDGAVAALGALVAPADVAGFAVVGVVPAGAAVVGAVEPAKARVAWAESPAASPNVRWHTNPCAACAAVGGHG